MNRKLIYVILLLFASFESFAQFSEIQTDSLGGLTFGLEHSEYVFADYGIKPNLHIGIRHSVKPEDETNQTFQVNMSYLVQSSALNFIVNPFVTSGWKMDYASMGLRLGISNRILSDKIQFGASVIPFYDTALKYRTCWEAALSVRIYKDIRVFAEFSDKPQYRIAYKRAYIGFDFKVLNLEIKPSLQIPIYDSDIRLRHSRICVSAAYNVPFRRFNNSLH